MNTNGSWRCGACGCSNWLDRPRCRACNELGPWPKPGFQQPRKPKVRPWVRQPRPAPEAPPDRPEKKSKAKHLKKRRSQIQDSAQQAPAGAPAPGRADADEPDLIELGELEKAVAVASRFKS
eukprot:3990206-Alexandrium_andersonii.AAC.1